MKLPWFPLCAALVAAFVVAGGLPSACALELREVRDPRPAGSLNDAASLLSPAARGEVEQIAAGLRDRTRAELVIVTVPTLDGRESRRFATDLFNLWQLGDPARNDGVLFLVAYQDRAAEIILGDGIDGPAEVAVADRIMRERIVPEFRAGRPEAAILAGTRALAAELIPAKAAQAAASAAASPAPAAVAPLPAEPDGLVERPVEAADAAPVPAPAEPAATPAPASQAAPRPARVSGSPAVWVLLLGGTGLAGLVGFVVYLSQRPRRCAACQRPMLLLSEVEDDQHLDAAQRTEERIGSVDYRAWMCPGCNTVEVTRHAAWFSRYSTCPSCGARTKSEVTSTLRTATTFQTGLVQIDESCAQCSYRNSHQRVVPRVVQTSHGHGHSQGHGARGFGGGGGRRTGGGHSSGRGSSGRW